MITLILNSQLSGAEEIYRFTKQGTWTFSEVSSIYAVGGFLFASTPVGLKILNIFTLKDSVKGVQLPEYRAGLRPVGSAYYKGVVYVGLNKTPTPEVAVVSFTDGRLITTVPTGGNIISLDVSSNYLFVLTSLGIEVYNISNPESPQNVANLVFSSGVPLSMYVGYPYVIVGFGQEGLVILKFNEQTLQKVYEYKFPSDPVLDVASYGPYLYIASGKGGIKILNINSQNPLVGGIETDKPASRVKVRGKYLFASLGEGGLVMYSLENPSSPVPVAYYSNRMFLYDFDVYSDVVALAFGTGGIITLKSNLLK